MLQSIIGFVSNSLVGLFIGVLFTVIFGLLPSIIMGKKRPTSVKIFNNIITHDKNVYDGLEFRYDKVVINELSETKIFFWNSGKKSIRGSDLLKDNPLGLSLGPDINIFRFRYLTTDRMKRTFALKWFPDEDMFIFDFDAIPKNEGFYIEILHSGNMSDSINIVGEIDGARISNRVVQYTDNIVKKTGGLRYISLPRLIPSLILMSFTGLLLIPHDIMFFPNIVPFLGAGDIISAYVTGILLLITPVVLLFVGIWSNLKKVPLKLRNAAWNHERFRIVVINR